MADEDFEPWTLPELTNALKSATPDGDGRVVRELTRRMAEQLPGVRSLDPGMLTLDLSYTLTAIAAVANEIISEWMSDLDDEERPDGTGTLVERLLACANDFQAISGTF
ncbi:MAG: hypothetical protein HOY79_17835 [Streptomyces sp.]|nr:hypothetical protein [Streptomyces sp.]